MPTINIKDIPESKMVKLVDLSEDSINKIAEAVVQKIAESVKHGHWIIRDNPRIEWYQITCSECGENVTSSAPCIGFLPNAKVLWDYCPYCGAEMDEVKKDGDT